MFSKWHCAFFKVDDRIPPTDPSFMKRKKPAETSGLLIESAEREALRAISPKVIKHAQTSILRAFVFF